MWERTDMITGEKYRITAITGRLIRLEWSDSGLFTDEKTQMVVCRDFDDPDYRHYTEDTWEVIDTGDLLLRYDGREFSPQGLMVDVRSMGTTWHYSVVYGNSDKNLFGTARTLDETDGYVRLDNGIFGQDGYAVLDDSRSAIETEGGFASRKADGLDIYFFGYGQDFRAGLSDFFSLCGKTPMIPRYALGNWWSRYYRYSADSYRRLLDEFDEEDIPLAVAVLDMDWHVTEVDPEYGTGWTGFSWNRELFPDPDGFLAELKDRGLAVTLNLHPADGIRAFEDMYPEVARDMGVDPASKKSIEFDFSDRRFRETYFDKVMHPYEKAGVDFWWIDWQQGTGCEGDVDPLFLLNHYHFEDQRDRGRRAMIFSRYAGPGSHRYPVGFSGDTHATWKSLNFQPFFTSTASNIGYGQWSHDIGGHMLGDRDDERLTRWVQFGVFSPIMRLHSSCSPFFNKEPWTLDRPYRDIIGRYMRLRHRLIPYLYSMNYLAHVEGRMLCEPIYYICPHIGEAYKVEGEYTFGTELLVGAITAPSDHELRMASANMYIPEGRYYDIFSGTIYEGGRRMNLYRGIDDIPVLLKSGGIVPLAADGSRATENPRKLCILAGYGSDGSFTLYEDDGLTMEYESGHKVTTTFELEISADGDAIVTIYAADGDLSLIPDRREYEIILYGVECDKKKLSATYGDEGYKVNYDDKMRTVTVILPEDAVDVDRSVRISGIRKGSNPVESRIFEILDRAWISTLQKERCFDVYHESESIDEFRRALEGTELDETLKGALKEILG